MRILIALPAAIFLSFGLAQAQSSGDSGIVKLAIVSSPDSAEIVLDNESVSLISPLELDISAGFHTLNAHKEGFEPLSHRLELLSGQNTSVRFLLRTMQPEPLTPEGLGLSYMNIRPQRDEGEAETLKKKFMNMAEFFAIIPTGQGLLARLVLGNGSQKEANTLIITGVGLTVGSCLLGKLFSTRRLTEIRTENKEIATENVKAKDHNKNVDKIVEQKNSEAVSEWLTENQDKGKVEVIIE